MGQEFNGNCFVRVDIREENFENNKWFYFEAKKSDEMVPLYAMEILDTEGNKATLKELEVSLKIENK